MAKINFKEIVNKVDTKKFLGFASIGVTLIGACLSSMAHENDQKALKEQLKKELTEELLDKKN